MNNNYFLCLSSLTLCFKLGWLSYLRNFTVVVFSKCFTPPGNKILTIKCCYKNPLRYVLGLVKSVFLITILNNDLGLLQELLEILYVIKTLSETITLLSITTFAELSSLPFFLQLLLFSWLGTILNKFPVSWSTLSRHHLKYLLSNSTKGWLSRNIEQGILYDIQSVSPNSLQPKRVAMRHWGKGWW